MTDHDVSKQYWERMKGLTIPPPIIPNIDFEADIEKDATFGKALYTKRRTKSAPSKLQRTKIETPKRVHTMKASGYMATVAEIAKDIMHIALSSTYNEDFLRHNNF